MADITTNPDGTTSVNKTNTGTDWGTLLTLLASLYGGVSSGQSLLGKPAGQVSSVGPLTPEGQSIMDEYTKELNATPLTSSTRMGNVKVTLPNRSRLGILKNMANFENARRGSLYSTQPSETGLLGKLAPLLASIYKDVPLKDIYKWLTNLGSGQGEGLGGTEDYWGGATNVDWTGAADTAADATTTGIDLADSIDWTGLY
jgi:hypothetical protein